MRVLSVLLLASLLIGCDQFGLGDGEAPALMDELDGTWSLVITNEVIEADGEVRPGDPATEPRRDVLIGRRVDCGPVQENVSDADRLLKLTGGGRADRCEVLTADQDALRIVFVGDGAVGTDVVGTIRERSASRHVWDFYQPLADGTARRFRWTLTPR
ncbi:MAG: hypothetical protein AAGK21_12190 [Bacteroidota bacterium]